LIILKDDAEFANAIECMVSYFYNTDYNVSQYDMPESLLHAQVATIAEKYDCASLYKLARASFANAVKAIEKNDWVVVATFVYNHTTIDWLPHKDLRALVVAAVANRPSVLKSILEMESTPGLLRSTLDLAIDLLLSTPYTSKIEGVQKNIFQCGKCQYAHVGPKGCAYVASRNGLGDGDTCPNCRGQSGVTFNRCTYAVGLNKVFPCPSCDGAHTLESVPQLQPPLIDDSGWGG
jgi:hypothetical protein